MGQSMEGRGLDWKSSDLEQDLPDSNERYSNFQHSTEILPDGSKMYILGGGTSNNKKDYYIYDFDGDVWERKIAPYQISFHVSHLFFNSGRTFIVVHGGWVGSSLSGKMFEIDITSDGEEWNEICDATTAEGTEIPAVRGHCCVVSPNDKELFIFGGSSSNSVYNNALYKYDVYQHHWEIVNPKSDEPPPRLLSSSVSIKKTKMMYVFGGIGERGGKLRDLWEYSFEQNRWKRLKFPNEENIISRSCHKMIVLKNNQGIEQSSYLYLGMGKYYADAIFSKRSKSEFNSIWKIDLEKKMWKMIPFENSDIVVYGSTMIQRKGKVYICLGNYRKIPKKYEDDLSFDDVEYSPFKSMAIIDIPDSVYFEGSDVDLVERTDFLKRRIEDPSQEELSCLCISNFGDKIYVMKSLLFL